MSSKKFRVRRARPEDADDIARVHTISWQEAYAGLLTSEQIASQTVEARMDQWRSRVAADNGVVLVAEDDEGLYGFASAGSDDSDPGIAELSAIYVLARGWGTPAGRVLMEKVLQLLYVEHGCKEAFLWVLEANRRARRFYETYGWVSDGGRKDCFGGVDAPAVRYRISIPQVNPWRPPPQK